MNTLNNLEIILGFQLTMGSCLKLIICELGALTSASPFIFSGIPGKSFRITDPAQASGISENDNWKLKILQ